MLLTLTTTYRPATDLGYLLHKNPYKCQSFPLAFGTAHVFYPEIREDRCTAALLLDIDPIDLVRGRKGPAGEGRALEPYVNDRPYVASSFLSVAIARVFGSALAGLSKDRPELADRATPVEARIAVLPCPALPGGGRFLKRLGYEINQDGQGYRLSHPPSRKAIFVGDLVDRGPKTPEVLRLAMGMVESGTRYCVAGNHDVKLMRRLKGREIRVSHGLAESLRQLEREGVEFRKKTIQFLDGLVSHYVFDDGKLVVAHAGLKEEMHGRGSGRVREFALYGETTGETDEYGLPVRHNWAADYRGRAMVIYGHTPVPKREWLNNTLCIDIGCVFGGHLTALRYPERELVSVPARQTYYDSIKPFLPENTAPSPLTAQQQADDLLDIQDVLGKRIIGTRLRPNITVREENTAAAPEGSLLSRLGDALNKAGFWQAFSRTSATHGQ